MNLSKALEGFTLARLSEGYSQSTISSYLSSLNLLKEYLGDPEVDAITEADLVRFFAWLRADYKPRRPSGDETPLTEAAIHGKWKAVRCFWNWATDELGVSNPALGLPMPDPSSPPITPFTHDDVLGLLAACERTAPDKSGRTQRRHTAIRDKAIVLVLLETGIRAGEFSRLLVGDVDMEAGQVKIRPHGRGHKTAGRVVFLGSAARRYLWRYLADRDPLYETDPLFLSEDDQPMTGNALKQMIRRLGKRAGIHAHPHKFRHTFAIEYLRNGGDVFTLQRLLGHSSLEMVKRYLGRGKNLGDSISAVGIFKIVRKYGKMIGRPDLAPHDLRRTYAQLGFDAGVPITQISILLGHENVATTQRYLDLDLDLITTASDFIPLE